MIEFLATVTVLYAIITIIIHFGLLKYNRITIHQPTVSILIAARNEEKNLENCLASLEKIEYSTEKLEILIINDRSEDKTGEIAKKFCDKNMNFKMIEVEDDIPELTGKINALCQGIEVTSNEIIMITDADCVVPPNWVKEFVKYFNKNVGMCGGMTLLSKPNKKETFFHRLQAVDWIYLQSVAAGSCQIGFPVSILGNNFAFRRAAYEEVGGFRKLGFSVTEDKKLMQAIYQTKKWQIVYPLSKGAAIYSNPLDKINDFYIQRKRWVLGGRKSHWWGLLMMLVSFLLHLLVLIALISGFLNFYSILALLLLFVADLSLILPMLHRFNRLYLWYYIFPFEIFYTLYSILFAAVYFTGKQVRWKGRKLST